MAVIHPSGWRELSATGGAARELETLSELSAELSDDYTVFHGLHWTNIQKGYSAYGEIDFIIVAPSGRVLLIEQKSGFLEETDEGLVKNYQGKKKNIHAQIVRTVQGLMTRFPGRFAPLSIDYLLYCPDYQVRDAARAGIDPTRIIDARRRSSLAKVILDILPPGEPAEQRDHVLRFLGDELDLVPDPSAMVGSARELVTKISGGLAKWARQLEFSPFRLRIIGTAGSGKTQLALAEYRAAVEQGKKPLYVCFNRPLADHVQRLVPSGGQVATYHMLCDALLRSTGAVPDYSRQDIWDSMEKAMLTVSLPVAWNYDVLIVDEGQDFTMPMRDGVLRLLKPDGRALWLEDPMQNLYGRDPVTLEGWVCLRSDANYRSPRQIVDMLRGLGAVDSVGAASPFLEADVDFLTFADGDSVKMHAQTKRAITACLGAGYVKDDMTILSWHGRNRSALLHLDQLGSHTLRSFTGEFDLFGSPMYRDGDLLAESVYRFKGQAAPAVIFTEIDFEALDNLALRKLFVGMTRARLKLVLVISERAAAQLLQRL